MTSCNTSTVPHTDCQRLSMVNDERLCSACQEQKVRSDFTRKQWEKKKYRRCKVCSEQGTPFQRPSRKAYETKSSKLLVAGKTSMTTQSVPSVQCSANSLSAANQQGNGSKNGNAVSEELLLSLRRAMRFLLQRNYYEALSVCNNYFRSILSEKGSSANNLQLMKIVEDNSVATIQCSLRRREQGSSLVTVMVDTHDKVDEPSIFDNMVVIALQCWEEIQNKQPEDDFMINPLIQALSSRAMTVEVFCVWMKYWQARGLWKEALEWNLQVLIKVACTTNLQPTEKKSAPIENKAGGELMIECLGHQLPRVEDSTLASDILEKIFEAFRNHPVDLDTIHGDLNLYNLALAMTEEPQAKSIHSIQLAFEKNSRLAESLVSSEDWIEIQASWEPYASMQSRITDDHHVDNFIDDPAGDELVPSEANEDFRIFTYKKSWKLVDSLVCWIRYRVRNTIQHVAKNPQIRSQVTLSLTLTLLAWRQKGILKLILGYILLPIKELVDALKLKE